jgi:GNAT superfamily N-acetyltransferase
MYMIKIISWEEIRHIWHYHLWPERTSAIEPNSAMNYLNGYDINNMTFTPTFFGYFVNNNLVGVNSGHLCVDNSFRSRGLWVDNNHRGYGYGKALLEAAIKQAKLKSASYIWSFPRKTSWTTYKSVGFNKTSRWIKSDTSDANCFCYKNLI